MRKILRSLAVAAIMSVAFAATAAESLFNFVPEKANVLVYLKFNEIINHPALQDARTKNIEFSSRYDEIEARFAKFNIKIEDLAGNMLIFREGEDDAGVVLNTGITEEKLKEIMASGIFSENNGGKLVESQMAGRKVFILSSPLRDNDIPNDSIKLDNEAILTYLDKNTVLVAEKSCFAKFVNEIAKSNVLANKEMMNLKKDVNTSPATAWAVFSIPQKAKKAASPQPAGAQQPAAFQQPGPDSIEGGCVAITLSGKDKSDIAVDALLECDNEQSAMMMEKQAQGLIMFGSMSMFSQNPQLGMKIGSAIKISSSGKNLNAKLNFPKTLMDEIKKYTEMIETMKQQPVPAMAPQIDVAPKSTTAPSTKTAPAAADDKTIQ